MEGVLVIWVEALDLIIHNDLKLKNSYAPKVEAWLEDN